MEINDRTILEIWELFSDYIQPGKRNDVAVKFLKIFLESDDVSIEDLEDLREEDEHLDYALDELGSDQEEEEDDADYED
jgi:hypothetical protein